MEIKLLTLLAPRPCGAMENRHPIIRGKIWAAVGIHFAIAPNEEILVFGISRLRLDEPFVLVGSVVGNVVENNFYTCKQRFVVFMKQTRLRSPYPAASPLL